MSFEFWLDDNLDFNLSSEEIEFLERAYNAGKKEMADRLLQDCAANEAWADYQEHRYNENQDLIELEAASTIQTVLWDLEAKFPEMFED